MTDSEKTTDTPRGEFPDRPTLERALLDFAPILRIGRKLPAGWFERRLRQMPSRSGDPMAPTGSRTGSGI
jgi:hypothetical protein